MAPDPLTNDAQPFEVFVFGGDLAEGVAQEAAGIYAQVIRATFSELQRLADCVLAWEKEKAEGILAMSRQEILDAALWRKADYQASALATRYSSRPADVHFVFRLRPQAELELRRSKPLEV